jgi:hypothetical protein
MLAFCLGCWSSALWREGFNFTAVHGSGTRPRSGFERCTRLVLFEWPFLRGHQHAGSSMADPLMIPCESSNLLRTSRKKL